MIIIGLVFILFFLFQFIFLLDLVDVVGVILDFNSDFFLLILLLFLFFGLNYFVTTHSQFLTQIFT